MYVISADGNDICVMFVDIELHSHRAHPSWDLDVLLLNGMDGLVGTRDVPLFSMDYVHTLVSQPWRSFKRAPHHPRGTTMRP